METTRFEIVGLKETLDVFQQLQNEIGDKEAKSKVLLPSVKEAMKPVLAMSKSLAPKDTGTLVNSLHITGRRPSRKDMRSKYINPTDSILAFVQTKPIPRKLKKEFQTMAQGLKGKEYQREKRKFYEGKNVVSDARAIAQEFGTAKMSAQPFMRTSLESQAQNVTKKLGEILKQKMEQYRSKKT